MTLMKSVSGSANIKHPDCFFIGGEWVKPSTDSFFDVVAPATEEVFLRVAEAQEADMNRAVAAARDAFDNGPWPKLTHAERAIYLRAIGAELARRAVNFAYVWPNEMGILYSKAAAAVEAMPSIYDYYADLASTFVFEERFNPASGAKIGLLVREPVGVVAVIIPWNGPMHLIAYKIAPALLAGCTVVIKASPEAPGAALIVAEMVEAVGLPPGVVNVITAERAVSELLVRHPEIDKIAFTGSSAAGKRIAAICGERIARYTLELGGKSAAVIMDDYSIAAAADSIVAPACVMTGQTCSSLTRIVVSRGRHDEMVDALASRFAAVRVGDPFDPESEMGPMAMRRQRDRIEQIMAKGLAEGASLATGGGRPLHLNRGFYIEPTIFGNVDNHSTLAREELFGPVLSVIPAKDEADAIRIANDTPYGLNNTVFTNDYDHAYAVARQLRSGTVSQNVWRGSEYSTPFGGFKQSGIGREGGVEGLLPYLECKSVILEGAPSHMAQK